MILAVSTPGTSLDAWVSADLTPCPRFLVVNSETMDAVLVSLPSEPGHPHERVRALLRAILTQGAEVVIAGRASAECREAIHGLGIEVVEIPKRITVRQAVKSYLARGVTALAEYVPLPEKIAVASRGTDLEANLHPTNEPCTALLLVDPRTMSVESVPVEAGASMAESSVNALRTAVRSGATAVITSAIRPACCAALNALGIPLVLADPGLTVGEAVRLYREGKLKPSYWYDL
jgi:predicted Fe-Mo cluster-binding NifX family protein